MATLKKLMCAAMMMLFTVGMSMSLQAQDAEKIKDPAQRAKMQTTELTSQLGLSDDQAAKVGEINQRYAERVNNIAASDADREAKGQQLKTLQSQKSAEFKQVLNDDQYNKYEKMVQDRHEKMKGHQKSDGQ
ncbi:hypothetical protein [Pontibacter sp. G13]|uniref:hypothetical protein n=1 Tax=Pontibacter sp. G13 TaxID=3074898 RepID=UPI00288908CA|nr:hypothetical protein [Pontibacter sp. G13]WNJ21627.1 hypothetical protein RJD25_28925 [Pontibacter sp. G13]